MKLLKTQPTEGQFIAIWKYNDHLWSATLRWEGDTLLYYNEDGEEYENDSAIWPEWHNQTLLNSCPAQYVVLK